MQPIGQLLAMPFSELPVIKLILRLRRKIILNIDYSASTSVFIDIVDVCGF